MRGPDAAQRATGTCRIIAARRDDHLHIEVTDEGPALRAPDHERGEAAGHRLGLDLARRLVETDGGRLRLPTSDTAPLTIVLPAPCDSSSGGRGHERDRV
jgi:hypothetical protein